MGDKETDRDRIFAEPGVKSMVALFKKSRTATRYIYPNTHTYLWIN